MPKDGPSPRAAIAQTLARVRSSGSFCTRHTAPPGDLLIEVEGAGPLVIPVPAEQAELLIEVARPARYGLREQTLLDPAVRDTWEIPRSRVKINKRRWNRTLRPILTQVATGLGLPGGARLNAELHSMLVYTPGQFFRPHQDSEKSDAMVASLVVTLPGTFTGSSLVVEHTGERIECRSSKNKLSFVAFYADCVHEVRPIRSGHRVVLTYNLMLADGQHEAMRPVADVETEVAERLREHFAAPSRARWGRRAGVPPNRLVYLLDHEYTRRGCDWSRLKGVDAGRATALRAAAGRTDCEATLALLEVREQWDCEVDDWNGWEYREPAGDPRPTDLIDSDVTIEYSPSEPLVASVGDDEVCMSTPTAQLEPYNSEFEGYMGNYGNTMDRWYRRAAVIVWPREQAFAVHAEASARWALSVIAERIDAVDLDTARTQVRALEPFWNETVIPTGEPGVQGKPDAVGGPGVMSAAVRVATGIEDPALASMMLRPIWFESLTADCATDLVALNARYGDQWTRALLDSWCGEVSAHDYLADHRRRPWTATVLVPLCEALRAAERAAGTRLAHHLLGRVWTWLSTEITRSSQISKPSTRDARQAELTGPVIGFFTATEAVDATALRDQAIALFRGDNALLSVGIALLRQTATGSGQPPATLDELRRLCADRLTARLTMPPRAPGDWSIPAPEGACCDLCTTLAAYLTDPDQRELAWPLKEQSRRHIHNRIDSHELLVDHRTIRTGRPFTLVLTKTTALFEAEQQARQRDTADLAWLRD